MEKNMGHGACMDMTVDAGVACGAGLVQLV